jgi:uncharacterized protein with NRDE domain
MCTVTFIPQPSGFILSSNRDETPLRAESHLKEAKINGKKIIFPSDNGGGTWLAFSDHGDVLCLLNGAFTKHHHRPPYAMSRGLMLLSFFNFNSIGEFLYHFVFDGIEPFTMVIYSYHTLYEFRWDGIKKYIKKLDKSTSHIYSSCTLYNEEVQKMRRDYFYQATKESNLLSLEQIRFLHHTGGPDDPYNAYVMNRDEKVKTISISHIVSNYILKTAKLYFENLELSRLEESELNIIT